MAHGVYYRYTYTRRCQEARPHQTCAAGQPPLAAGPAARPVQVVSADVQSATRTCTDLPRRSVSTSGIS